MDCSDHPGIPAITNCAICGKPICMQCERHLGIQIICETCMTREKNRPAGSTDQIQNIIVPQETNNTSSPSIEFIKPNIGMAILYGFVAAIISAVFWDKIVFYTHYKAGIVAIVIGFLVGISVLKGSKGGYSKTLPIAGAVLAGFGILLGEFLLVGDLLGSEVAKHAANGKHITYIGQLVVSMLVFPSYLFGGGMTPVDWIFILIGVYEGWRIPSRAMNSSFSNEKR